MDQAFVRAISRREWLTTLNSVFREPLEKAGQL